MYSSLAPAYEENSHLNYQEEERARCRRFLFFLWALETSVKTRGGFYPWRYFTFVSNYIYG